MDIESLKEKVVFGKETAYLEIKPGMRITWPTPIIAQFNRKKDRYLLEIPVPPSALLQHALDCMITHQYIELVFGLKGKEKLCKFLPNNIRRSNCYIEVDLNQMREKKNDRSVLFKINMRLGLKNEKLNVKIMPI